MSRKVCSSVRNRIRLEVLVGFLGSSFLLFTPYPLFLEETGARKASRSFLE